MVRHLGRRCVRRDADLLQGLERIEGRVSPVSEHDGAQDAGLAADESRQGREGVIVHDVEQRTEAWHALRLGRVCGSRAHDMLATTRSGGEAAGRRNLRAQLVLERLTGRTHERVFQSQAMLDGIEREESALALYQAATGMLLQPVGYVSHDTLQAGASPDGVFPEWDGFVEVKSPIPATHLDYLKSGTVPDDYHKQMLHLAWLLGVHVGDFVSFQPDFPEPLRLKVTRVTFTDAQLEQHEKAVRVFLFEIERELDALNTMFNLTQQLKAAVA